MTVVRIRSVLKFKSSKKLELFYLKYIQYMKLVREHINEKFTQDSDPIEDMGIGFLGFLKSEAKRLLHFDYELVKKEFNIHNYHIDNEDHELFICLIAVSMLGSIAYKKTVPNAFYDAYNYWKHNFSNKEYPGPYFAKIKLVQILKDKYGIEWDAQKVYEKFTEDSDPIEDMSIGIRAKIKKWCKEMWIDDYFINDDMSIDVFYDVTFNMGDMYPRRGHHKGFQGVELPDYIQFGTVHGDFKCQASGLKTLRGVPYYVKGTFFCSANHLTSFEYAPKQVDGDFFCYDNIGYKMKPKDEKYLLKHCKIKGRAGISIYE